jgi:EAL domain-containing protein (putative c-di-GMP-specific phosphodiesterase class I)
MRWLKDGSTVATPDVFIPLADEAGLTPNVTWHALSNALRQVAPLEGIGVAVNVSPAMLHHREFLDMVQTAVENWQTRPGQLTLEVTEGGLIADFEQAIARLTRLRDLGIRISIDDFGTGYSSLSYFKKIPAHELKIDKSFVSRMLQETADRRLVETIVTLASQFSLDIVAEGVEDRATLDALASIGCHYAQGHLFAPALSFEQFRGWLAR